MTNKERQQKRSEKAKAAGYVPKNLPADVEWAGLRLPDLVDEQSHRATLALRDLKQTTNA